MKVVFCKAARLFCFLVIGLAVAAPVAFSQGRDTVLVENKPPLTQSMVEVVVDFFEWSLRIRLPAEKKAEMQQALIDAWKKNDQSEIASTLKIIQLQSELYKLSDSDLSQARGPVRDEVLKGLRAQPGDKISAMLLSVYESSSAARSNQTNPSNTISPTNSPPPAPVKVGAGDLYGVYIATTKQLIAPGPDSRVQYGITWQPGRDWITFLPGGRFYAALPNQGLAGFDYAEAARKNPAWTGTYEIKGDVIRVKWTEGGEKIFKRTADGDLWEEKTNWTPLPKANGLRLNGKYAVLWNEQSARYHIQLTQNGRFEEFGMLHKIGWDGYSDTIWDPKDTPRGNGTYSIYDNTLELRYSDGRVVKISFYIFAEEAKKARPEEIYINSFDFKLTQ